MLVLIAASLIVCNLSAQKKNVIKLNFLSPVVKTLNLQYEHALGAKNSFQLGLFYTGAKSGDVSLSGFGITPEYRMYFSEEKDAPAGFFLAPFIRYQNFTLKADVLDNNFQTVEGKASLSAFRPGLLVGYQWLFSGKVSFEMFIGPAYSISSYKITSDYGKEEDFSLNGNDGFGIRTGFAIGIAF
jgi:outer membrane autotransporter protein